MQFTYYTSDQHPIRHDQIDPEALYAIKRLKDAGHTAYIVGGGVRDLLLGIPPKDFDISTSAHPEQIKALFKRGCLLIGRRFRLAHLRLGGKVFEVATFRAGDPTEGSLVLRDNTWGSEEEDVLRRDFTINGLFYDPEKHIVIDYVGGWKDLQQRLLRTIGDPILRFRQDPVRMLRLVKFRARLGFAIDEQTLRALTLCKEEIIKSSPARVLEELFRMLESGYALSFFRLLQETELLELLLPQLAQFMRSPKRERTEQLLNVADQLNKRFPYHPLERGVLAACLIYPIVEELLITRYGEDSPPHMGQILATLDELFHEMTGHPFSHFPRKLRIALDFILTAQFRFSGPFPHRSRMRRMLHHEDFSAALRFFQIRASANPQLASSYLEWRKFAYQQRHERIPSESAPFSPPPPPPLSELPS